MMRTIGYPILAILALFWTGCDTQQFDEREPEVVVEAYLIAGEDIPFIRLSRTASSRVVYDFTSHAVTDATVTVSLLDDAGAAEEVLGFVSSDSEPGVYRPLEEKPVLAGRTYRLEVSTPGGAETVRATTIVPGAFELVRANADTLQYQGADQLELDVTRSFYPGRQS
jgi:hypothetical protein